MAKKIISWVLTGLLIFAGYRKHENHQEWVASMYGHCDELYYADYIEAATGHRPQELTGLNGKYWTKDTLKVLFLDGDAQLQADNLSYFKEWEKYCRIRIIQVQSWDDKPDQAVTFTAGGSWSFIGTDCKSMADIKQPTMQLGWNLQMRSNVKECRLTAMHEMGHELGCVHEHQSPNFPYQWYTALLYPDYKQMYGWSEQQTYNNIVFKYSQSQVNATVYDPTSIMHYAFDPKYIIGGVINTVRNSEISTLDRKHVGTIYPYKVVVPDTSTTYTGKYTLVTQGKPAAISSTLGTFVASKATDGIIGADNSNVGYNFFHTQKEVNPWISIDMQQSYKISHFELYNRSGCAACVGRLNAFRVYVSDNPVTSYADLNTVYENGRAINDGEIIKININKSGRYLTLMANNPGGNYLHLSEVQGYIGDGSQVICKDTIYKVPHWSMVIVDSAGKVCR